MFKVKIAVRGYTKEEAQLLDQGVEVTGSQLNEMTFYFISSIAPDYWNNTGTYIYIGENSYYSPLPFEEVETLIDNAKKKHDEHRGFWKN